MQRDALIRFFRVRTALRDVCEALTRHPGALAAAASTFDGGVARAEGVARAAGVALTAGQQPQPTVVPYPLGNGEPPAEQFMPYPGGTGWKFLPLKKIF